VFLEADVWHTYRQLHAKPFPKVRQAQEPHHPQRRQPSLDADDNNASSKTLKYIFLTLLLPQIIIETSEHVVEHSQIC
jgi:hypothetical protein